MKMRNKVEGLFKFVCLLPWINLAVIYSTASYIRLSFGKWPQVYVDSPDIPHIIDSVLAIAMLVHILGLLVYPFLSLLLGLLYSFKRNFLHRQIWLPSVVFVSGMILSYLIGWIDPYGFQDWFWD